MLLVDFRENQVKFEIDVDERFADLMHKIDIDKIVIILFWIL
jgi:hypothetical protein